MTNNPRKHHFIPECYLALFTNSKRTFWKMDKNGGKPISVSPAQVCYEIDSNKIRTINPVIFDNVSDEYIIEKQFFREQENNYGKTIREIIKYSPSPVLIDRDKYHLFLETLVTIKRRNPVSRSAIINAFSESIKHPNYISHFKKLLGEEIGEENLPYGIEEYIRTYLEGEARNPDRHYDMYLSAYINKQDYTVINNIKNDLYSLRQFILHAPIGTQFITSDNPGFTIIGDRVLNFGGFGDSFTFCFPLSPLCCLLIKSIEIEKKNDLEKMIYSKVIEKKEVQYINKLTQSISDKQIFSLSREVLKDL